MLNFPDLSGLQSHKLINQATVVSCQFVYAADISSKLCLTTFKTAVHICTISVNLILKII